MSLKEGSGSTTTIKCRECGDTGWITVEAEPGVNRTGQCRCSIQAQKEARIKRLFASARIPPIFKNATLDDFERGRHPAAYKVARGYLDRWEANREEGKGLTLVGGTGVGKTHLAFGILNALLGRGVESMVATVPDLLEDLRPGESRKTQQAQVLKEIDFLILDDLGSQKNTEWVTEQLFIIINARYSYLKPTLVTSNHFIEDLAKAPGWLRIVDRLLAMNKVVVMKGGSYRVEQYQNH